MVMTDYTDETRGLFWQAPEDRDRASEARHGGRYITEQLATRNGEDAVRLRELQDRDDPTAVSRWWAYSLSPSGGTGSGRDSTQHYAQTAARIGGADWEHSAYWQPQPLAETVFDWPIYRAAMHRTPEALADFIWQRTDLDREWSDNLAKAIIDG
jgi:hypothetical protein